MGQTYCVFDPMEMTIIKLNLEPCNRRILWNCWRLRSVDR
jgi:hypothetical protein